MKILIRRLNTPGGGEDIERLADVISEAGYAGEFELLMIDDSGIGSDSDDIQDGELIYTYNITVA